MNIEKKMMKNNLQKTVAFVGFIVIYFLVLTTFNCNVLALDPTGEKSVQKLEPINESGNHLMGIDSIVTQIDTITGTPEEKIVKANSDSANVNDQIKSYDSTKYNMFGDLLDDDPVYNKKQKLWIPLLEVPAFNIIIWAINRYVSNEDFARVSPDTWSYNIKEGWVWDVDRFGMNFLAHPISGGVNFLSARSNGYNFWESVPFAIGGSLMWEYFCENTQPSYNDIINTPISGAFYGEILYRLGSNILDDRTTGTERFIRELSAAIISPSRFFNRLIQGKLSKVVYEEVYQKEPLNIELSLGTRLLNEGSQFLTGPQNITANIQLDYGYQFEKRSWKPFDYFKIRAGFNFGVGRKIIESINGYGILFGKTFQAGDHEYLFGMFQHYNYFDNRTFELGALAFGGGFMSKLLVAKETFLFNNLYFGVVPLAGNSTRFGPDTSQIRDYNYGGGLEAKFESGLNLGWASLQFIGYYYWIHTYVGRTGNNFIGIFRPRITVRLYRNINIGIEQLIYYSDRYTADVGNYHMVRTEQRIYLMVNVGNFKL